MKLSEALKASKVREAVGRLPDEIAIPITPAFSMSADDVCVTFLYPLSEVTVTWIDLLPGQREIVEAAIWEPVDPKNPLIQLAETLTDWTNEEDDAAR